MGSRSYISVFPFLTSSVRVGGRKVVASLSRLRAAVQARSPNLSLRIINSLLSWTFIYFISKPETPLRSRLKLAAVVNL